MQISWHHTKRWHRCPGCLDDCCRHIFLYRERISAALKLKLFPQQQQVWPSSIINEVLHHCFLKLCITGRSFNSMHFLSHRCSHFLYVVHFSEPVSISILSVAFRIDLCLFNSPSLIL